MIIKQRMHSILFAKQYNDTILNKSWFRTEPVIFNFKEEGMCEYWGLRSTMINFGLTFEEVMKESMKGYGSDYNIPNYLNNTDIDLFLHMTLLC